jgi:hypothetical protein
MAVVVISSLTVGAGVGASLEGGTVVGTLGGSVVGTLGGFVVGTLGGSVVGTLGGFVVGGPVVTVGTAVVIKYSMGQHTQSD